MIFLMVHYFVIRVVIYSILLCYQSRNCDIFNGALFCYESRNSDIFNDALFCYESSNI